MDFVDFWSLSMYIASRLVYIIYVVNYMSAERLRKKSTYVLLLFF